MGCSHVCTAAIGIQGPVSGWPFASASWSAITEESGSTPNPVVAHPSASPSPSEAFSGNRPPRILVAEDNEPDVLLIREALQTAGIPPDSIEVASDGEKAIRFFEELEAGAPATCPDLVLLDINLPKKKGGEILRCIRAGKKCVGTKVLVVTSSRLDRDRQEMDRLGANAYFLKPSDYAAFMQLGTLVRTLLGLNAASGG